MNFYGNLVEMGNMISDKWNIILKISWIFNGNEHLKFNDRTIINIFIIFENLVGSVFRDLAISNNIWLIGLDMTHIEAIDIFIYFNVRVKLTTMLLYLKSIFILPIGMWYSYRLEWRKPNEMASRRSAFQAGR